MDGERSGASRPKAAPATKVKVVVSRYAQALQQTNLDAKVAVSAKRTATAPGRSGRPTIATASASVKASAQHGAVLKSGSQVRPGVVSTVAKPAFPSPPILSTSNNPGYSTSGSASDSGSSLSISEKLRLYRAEKALAKQNGAPATSIKTTGRLTPRPFNPPPTAPRPTLLDKITPPTEKAPLKSMKRPATAQITTPTARRVTTPTKKTGRTTPGTATVAVRTKASAPINTSAVIPSVAVARGIVSSIEQELELLECLYLQLCFTEAKAAEAFRTQEQNAERQMLTACEILQSKLQVLHDTSMRLDRELHTRDLELHLADQAEPSIRLAAIIHGFNDDLSVLTQSLGASLQRMPTPGVVCSPPELKHQLESLSTTLVTFSTQLETGGMGSKVSDALKFTEGMETATEQMGSLLLQVGHLLEQLHLEINTEASLKAHRIQQARVDRTALASDWW